MVEGQSLVQLMGRFKRAGESGADGEARLSFRGQELIKWVGSVGATDKKMSIAATMESTLHAPIKIQGKLSPIYSDPNLGVSCGNCF